VNVLCGRFLLFSGCGFLLYLSAVVFPPRRPSLDFRLVIAESLAPALVGSDLTVDPGLSPSDQDRPWESVGFYVAPDLHAGSRTDLRVYCIVVEESPPALTVRETTCEEQLLCATRESARGI
jgi:hypothetical protein